MSVASQRHASTVTAGQFAGPSTFPVSVSLVSYAQTRVGPNITPMPQVSNAPCGSTAWLISFIVTVSAG